MHTLPGGHDRNNSTVTVDAGRVNREVTICGCFLAVSSCIAAWAVYFVTEALMEREPTWQVFILLAVLVLTLCTYGSAFFLVLLYVESKHRGVSIEFGPSEVVFRRRNRKVHLPHETIRHVLDDGHLIMIVSDGPSGNIESIEFLHRLFEPEALVHLCAHMHDLPGYTRNSNAVNRIMKASRLDTVFRWNYIERRL